MRHLQTLKLDHPDIMKMMDDINALHKLHKKQLGKVIPALEKDLYQAHAHGNRLASIAQGKISELFNAMQIIYSIDEPENGFALQFNYEEHLVRLIDVKQTPHKRYPCFKEDGNEWKHGISTDDELDESQIDWDNPEQVAIYNKQRAKKWDEIRNQKDDGIDWQKQEENKEGDDDEEPPQTQKV